jgi:hypothetical protein
MRRYRALEGTGGRGKARVVIQREGEALPQWVCDAGTLIEAEMIADALNSQGAVSDRDALRLMLSRLLDVALVDGYGETVADEARALLTTTGGRVGDA